MNCLLGSDRDLADKLLSEIADDPRLEFLATNDDRDFIANAIKCRHIHWPTSWLEALQGIHDKLFE